MDMLQCKKGASMELKKLLQDVDVVATQGNLNIEIEYLSHFHQDIQRNSVFFCIQGEHLDGSQYAFDAVSHGAIAIVTEKYLSISVTQIIVKDTRKAMAIMAKNFYQRACDRLTIIGVTGSNGKTSCTYILASILKEQGISYGIIGTDGAKIGDEILFYGMTTPDPIILHHLFLQMVERGVTHVVMEVSAHAIALQKMEGITLAVGVLTSITYEHIEFFKTFEKYANTKMQYFKQPFMKEAVVNVDQNFGVYIAKNSNISCVTYALYNPANTFAVDVEMHLDGMTFIVNCLDDILYITTSLVGTYNVYNILACITVAKLLGIAGPVIAKGIENMKKIDGRMEVIHDEKKTIIVDFAHTIDSFEQVLSHVKQFCHNKLYVLFGTTYYANAEKCRQLGKIADKYVDVIILTADNPDRTNVTTICHRIEKGIEKHVPFIIEDRKKAIRFAISQLKEHDVLVCLGKGAEKYQKIDGQLVPYQEVEVIKSVIRAKE